MHLSTAPSLLPTVKIRCALRGLYTDSAASVLFKCVLHAKLWSSYVSPVSWLSPLPDLVVSCDNCIFKVTSVPGVLEVTLVGVRGLSRNVQMLHESFGTTGDDRSLPSDDPVFNGEFTI